MVFRHPNTPLWSNTRGKIISIINTFISSCIRGEKPKNSVKKNILQKNEVQTPFHKIMSEFFGNSFTISLNDIYYLKATKNFTEIHCFENVIYMNKPLSYFQNTFGNNHLFYALQQSYIINFKHLKEVTKKDGYKIILNNDIVIPIEENEHKEFLKVLRYIFD